MRMEIAFIIMRVHICFMSNPALAIIFAEYLSMEIIPYKIQILDVNMLDIEIR